MKKTPASLLLILFWSLASAVQAHEVRPAYLEIRQSSADTYDVLWKVPAAGADLRLGVYVRFPEETEELTTPRRWFADGAYLERSRVRLAGGLAGRTISFDGLAATRIEVLARVDLGEGAVQTARILPDAPSFSVDAAPTAWRVSVAYLGLGIEHILLGIDHLLFVLALVLLVKGWKRLLGTITAFTVAHSLTLAAATLGLVHVPGPPVEACIALSIVFVAAEIIRGTQGVPGLTERAPWLVAFTFGLLHGLGFARALSDVGLPSQAIPMALLFFNVGVELGQLFFVGVLIVTSSAALWAWERSGRPLPGWSRRLLPYAIGAMAMFWVIERTVAFQS